MDVNIKTELCSIATKYGTDKVNHGYTLYYHDLFKKNKNIKNFLELGIYKGASAKMWCDYFPNTKIYCIDNCEPEKCSGTLICPPEVLQELNYFNTNIKAINCKQDDRDALIKTFNDVEFSYIVDDASHYQEESQISLAVLFKNLESKGVYIIEDICNMWAFQTGSWWGQSDGKDDTNAGNNGWLDVYKKTGTLKDPSLFKDTIWYVLNSFIETGVFDSPYLTKEENEYLKENIESIELVAAPEKRSDYIHSLGVPTYPGTKDSKLTAGCIGIIHKK